MSFCDRKTKNLWMLEFSKKCLYYRFLHITYILILNLNFFFSFYFININKNFCLQNKVPRKFLLSIFKTTKDIIQ